MTFRVAAAPITWGVCELPGWGAVPPPERVLDEMAAAGFQGTELGSPGFLPEDAKTLRAELHKRALQLVGAFCPLPLSAPDGGAAAIHETLGLARLLADAGCETLVAADAGDDERRAVAGRVHFDNALAEAQWHRAGAALDELADRCAPLGVRVVFHPHAGTYVETQQELDALMTATSPARVGLCLDTGHLAYGGADPVEVADRYASRVRHVHVKDVSARVLARVRDQGIEYSQAVGEGVFAPLGEGSIDFATLVRRLVARGYDGWWVLEQDIRLGPPWPPRDPAANARNGLRYLRSLAA
ncbi:MAG TPA: TIM barrel protein [Chloroflexota bacterium]|nr:TIM barrel protein [Chloroflexota bacterium]